MIWITTSVAVLITFLVLDALWLGVIAKSFYSKQLGSLMREQILKAPAGIFYVFYAIGLTILAVKPNDPTVSWQECLATGALIGFLSYGTYNMTNLSTLAKWPRKISYVDWTWGTIISGLCAASGYFSVSLF